MGEAGFPKLTHHQGFELLVTGFSPVISQKEEIEVERM